MSSSSSSKTPLDSILAEDIIPRAVQYLARDMWFDCPGKEKTLCGRRVKQDEKECPICQTKREDVWLCDYDNCAEFVPNERDSCWGRKEGDAGPRMKRFGVHPKFRLEEGKGGECGEGGGDKVVEGVEGSERGGKEVTEEDGKDDIEGSK